MDWDILKKNVSRLRASQFWPPEQVTHAQGRLLATICSHAAEHVPFYAKTFADPRIDDNGIIDPAWFRSRPILLREHVQDCQDALTSRALHLEPAPPRPFETAGSSGSPVRTLWSRHANTRLVAFESRLFEWMGVNPLDRCCSIYHTAHSERPASRQPWYLGSDGPPASAKGMSTPVSELIDWLFEQQPALLIGAPTIVRELVTFSQETGTRIEGLNHVLTVGETMRDGFDQMVRDAWWSRLFDKYASREVGIMAVSCPDSPYMHIQAENTFVELLRDDGTPADDGETGSVIVTNLHNTAMPIIRYKIGDMAVAGPPCPCGRGLPTLRRILGKERDMLTQPDGQKFFIFLNTNDITKRVPVRRFQVRQKTPTLVHLRYVTPEPLTQKQEASLHTYLLDRLPEGMAVETHRCDDIPRLAKGKYRDIMSDVS